MEAMLSRADRARLRESEAKLRSLVSALEGTRCSGDVLHDELMAIKSEQNDNANVQLEPQLVVVEVDGSLVRLCLMRLCLCLV